MNLIHVVLGNLTVLCLMIAFTLAWNFLVRLRRRRLFSQPTYTYKLERSAWSIFYWRRVKSYLISYAVVLSVLVFLPLALGRPEVFLVQSRNLVQLIPGLAAFFLLAGSLPARFAFYPEGFGCFSLIPFLPGKRDKKSRIYNGFRVGLRFWREFRDVSARQEILVLKGDRIGTEIVMPRGQRDYLLTLAREGLKQARVERHRSRREERLKEPPG